MILQQNKKARKQRAFNLHNSLLFKEVPPTGLEPVRPCGQQILSLQRLPVPPQAQIIFVEFYTNKKI